MLSEHCICFHENPSQSAQSCWLSVAEHKFIATRCLRSCVLLICPPSKSAPSAGCAMSLGSADCWGPDTSANRLSFLCKNSCLNYPQGGMMSGTTHCGILVVFGITSSGRAGNLQLMMWRGNGNECETLEDWKQISNHCLSEIKRQMALNWLKSFLVVVTSQPSHVVVAQGNHSWECVWERMVSTLPLGVEGRNHVCVNRGKGEGNKRKKTRFFSNISRERGRIQPFLGESWSESSDNWWTSWSGGCKHQSIWWVSVDISERRWCVWRQGELFLAHAYCSTCCFPLGEIRFFLGLDPYRTSCW